MKPIGLKRGFRTPFTKMDKELAGLNAVDLSVELVNGLLERIDFPAEKIGHLIWGMVLPDPNIYSIARETVLGSALDNRVEAYSISRACATSLQAATNAASFYNAFPGEGSLTIAGGVDSFSSIRPVVTSKAARLFKVLASRAPTKAKLKALFSTPPKAYLPVPPSAKEYSTGLTMGEHCELMVKAFKISRGRQDRFAIQSHQRAAAARDQVTEQIIPVAGVSQDTLIRKDASLESLAGLRAAFDKSPTGTLTAGNSSPLTDGAAALTVISPALEAELRPDAYLVDFEFVGVEPQDGLLMGPGKAMLRLLKRQGLKWSDLDYIEIHEAFAGQVLCNVDAVNDPNYRQSPYGVSYDAGRLEEAALNPWGSSVAYGHPFGATGARMLNQAIAYLEKTQKRQGLVAACTAGALAGAVLVRRP